ncbi:MAG: hypothetical protein IH989_08160, partial [Planctomycetes bacterium]|nr:hypothetical protein [Planctomycetota bacterium]
MKRYLHAVTTGLLVFVSASLSGAQQPSRLEHDIASTITMLPAHPAGDSTQGAAAAEGGCPVDEIPDCNGTCAPDTWPGDGFCDDGTFDWPEGSGIFIFFNCAEFCCDEGDCPAEQCGPSTCGDGVLLSCEECDDGNTTPGDGCSATCQIEGGALTYSVHHMIGER